MNLQVVLIRVEHGVDRAPQEGGLAAARESFDHQDAILVESIGKQSAAASARRHPEIFD
mgnify:CR=1 FL=1